MKKSIMFTCLLLLLGCSLEPTKRAPLPTENFLVIAHRGASAYLPEHTIPAYELAVEMEADYIELDLHMTKDGKLVALHEKTVLIDGKEHAVANLNLKDLQGVSPGSIFNEVNPEFASPAHEALAVPELGEILSFFKDEVNYYIELKSLTATPGMEEELLHQLQEHNLLNRVDELPKVIVQSYSENSLKKVFELEPTIPLVKLYNQKTSSISNKEIHRLGQYASGIGVNQELVTKELVNRLHGEGLHIHPFVINDPDTMEAMKQMGVDGIFTDTPDLAVKLKGS